MHEAQLWALVDLGGSLGAAAAAQIVHLEKARAKERLLDAMLSKPDDYNLCVNGIGVALKPFITEDDALKVANWAESLQDRFEEGDDLVGFQAGAAKLLEHLDIDYTAEILLKDKDELHHNNLKTEIMCDLLGNLKTTAALRLASDLLLKGAKQAVITIFFICKYSSSRKLDYGHFNSAHVSLMLETIYDEDSWSFDTLSLVCSGRRDLATLVKNEAIKQEGLARAILLYCTEPSNEALIFNALEELVANGVGLSKRIPLELNELNWEGKEGLLTELVQLRDARLVDALLVTWN